jgi:hypothetical protein
MSLLTIDQVMSNQSNSSSSVPDHIRNFNGPGTAPVSIDYIDRKDKSNLLITLNTNFSWRQLSGKSRDYIYQRLNDFMTQLGEEFKEGHFIIEFKGSGPSDARPERWEYAIEFGNKHGMLHAHAILILSEKAHIDIANANKFVNDSFKDVLGEGEKMYLNIKNFPDTHRLVESYIRKQQQR